MNPLGDADAVDRLAAACEQEAGRLELIGRRWTERLDRARWSCHRAEHFRAVIRSRRSDIDHHAGDLRDLARDLRHHATWIRDRTRQIAGIEQAVRSWFAAHVPEPGEIAQWAAWNLPSLPVAGHPDWEDLARRMRRFGADL